MKSSCGIFTAMLTLILLTCNSNTTDPETQGHAEEYLKIESFQQQGDSLFRKICSYTDTSSAIESLAVFLKKSPLVDSVTTSKQGVAVKYENGTRGGYFIRPLDDNAGTTPPPQLQGLQKSLQKRTTSATVRNAILMVPHFNERTQQTQNILTRYNYYLPMNGYALSTNFGAVSMDILCDLSSFDFIHIYSHGWAWPNESAYCEVYVMTNQQVSASIDAQYEEDIKNGDIVIGWYQNKNVYFVNSHFITRHNTFKNGEKFFYGGFCYSFLGTWSTDLIDAGFDAFTGFTWSVNTNWNAYWAQSMCEKMSDTTGTFYKGAMPLEYWYDSVPSVKKFYHDSTSNKDVYIHYAGKSDYTLWNRLRIVSLIPKVSTVGSNVVIKGQGFGVSKDSGSVAVSGINAPISVWSADSIVIQIPPGANSGDVVVSRGILKSNAARISIDGPQIYSLTPDTGHANDSVVILGSHFGSLKGKVLFDTTEASLTHAIWDSSRLAVFVPANVKTCMVRVLTRGSSYGSNYDTSNGLVFNVAIPKPVITSVKPPYALADTHSIIHVQGKWWKQFNPPNSLVKISEVPLTISNPGWYDSVLHIKMSPLIPQGLQNLTLVYDSVQSDPMPFFAGLPPDTIAKYSVTARFPFSIHVNAVTPKGEVINTGASPNASTLMPFVPVTWSGRVFSFSYVNDYGRTTTFTGTIGESGTDIVLLKIKQSSSSSNEDIGIELMSGKTMPFQPNYRNNFTNLYTSKSGFPPPTYEVEKNYLTSTLSASGIINISEGACTVTGVDSAGISSFWLEFSDK